MILGGWSRRKQLKFANGLGNIGRLFWWRQDYLGKQLTRSPFETSISPGLKLCCTYPKQVCYCAEGCSDLCSYPFSELAGMESQAGWALLCPLTQGP
jgi:hypothetical protein